MPLLVHRRLSMVWVSHLCGSARTLGNNAWAGSLNYLTREVVRHATGINVQR